MNSHQSSVISLTGVRILVVLGVVLAAGCSTRQAGVKEAVVRDPAASNFSFGYWLNGWRKSPDDTSPDVLAIETGRYGFMLDVDDLANPRFGRIDDNTDYVQALAAGTDRVGALPPAELDIALDVDGTTYRAVTCRAGRETDQKRLRHARLWESGRIAQHYDMQGLVFRDSEGNALGCDGTLDLVAWPGSLTLNVSLAPSFAYADGPTQGVAGNGWCVAKKPIDVPHRPELEPDLLTLESWVNIPKQMNPKAHGWLICKNSNEWEAGNYGFMYRRGTVVAAINNTGGAHKQHTVGQHVALEPGTWYHLALTFDGAALRLFVDGRQRGITEVKAPRAKGSGHLRIGQRADGLFGVVGGLYDQVRVWNRALPAAELAGHAREPASLSSRDGLVFEKNFDEGPAFGTPVWSDAGLRMLLKSAEGEWRAETRVDGAWATGERHALTLTCNQDDRHAADRQVGIRVSTPGGQDFPVRFDPERNCHVAEVKGLKRSFKGGWEKITDYDDFDLVFEVPAGDTRPVPFLLDFYNPANIAGLVPILCHEDGTPTGIPLQLSKNWHYRPTGAYLRAYALIPVEPGQNRYRLRVAYAFYGTLPSASHGQLSLVGWGANGRWDQLALASGGESITFDVDMSPTDVAVCDVRLPFARHTKDGNPWGWSDAGWGGDWLGIFDGKKRKLAFAGMKAAYLSHGPCLSDVLYRGAYGSDRSVLVDAQVQLPRTDDYGRTFQKLDYRFQKELAAADTYLMRRHANGFDSVVAYGNAEGLIAEAQVTVDMKKGDLLIPPTEIKGPGPWWIAFPGRTRRSADKAKKDWGFGYVSMVIRDYDASFGGTSFPNPFLMARVEAREGGEAKLETWLVPPPGVDAYKPGDSVRLDTEWVHLHRNAADYGGPNDVYRKHLAVHPQSWRTTYREVEGNSLEIDVDGGELLQDLPIVIRAEKPSVAVNIRGGVGYVPIRFEGLGTAEGVALYEVVGGKETKLDQSVHGNDFWQTDYDAGSSSYSMTFNLPLDGKTASEWVLR